MYFWVYMPFNKELSSARVKVECAFGVLESRWRILLKRLDSGIPYAVRNAVACAVLHNICIRSGDEWDDEEEDQVGSACNGSN